MTAYDFVTMLQRNWRPIVLGTAFLSFVYRCLLDIFRQTEFKLAHIISRQGVSRFYNASQSHDQRAIALELHDAERLASQFSVSRSVKRRNTHTVQRQHTVSGDLMALIEQSKKLYSLQKWYLKYITRELFAKNAVLEREALTSTLQDTAHKKEFFIVASSCLTTFIFCGVGSLALFKKNAMPLLPNSTPLLVTTGVTAAIGYLETERFTP